MNPETTELRKFRVESVDLASLGRIWEIEYDPKTGYVHMLREETDPEVDLDPTNPNDFAGALTGILMRIVRDHAKVDFARGFLQSMDDVDYAGHDEAKTIAEEFHRAAKRAEDSAASQMHAILTGSVLPPGPRDIIGQSLSIGLHHYIIQPGNHVLILDDNRGSIDADKRLITAIDDLETVHGMWRYADKTVKKTLGA